MDSLPLVLSSGILGFIIGKCSKEVISKVNKYATRVACYAIDKFVEIKWALKPEVNVKGNEVKDDAPSEQKHEWVSVTDHYKIYKINDDIYITFNMTHEPSLHFEDGSVEEIIVIRKDGTKVNPSPLLKDIISKCGGHGCNYASGIPTIEQLRKLPSPELVEELTDVKKIIINTTSFDEYIVI